MRQIKQNVSPIRVLIAHFEKYRDFYSLLNHRGLLYLLKDSTIDISPDSSMKMLSSFNICHFFNV